MCLQKTRVLWFVSSLYAILWYQLTTCAQQPDIVTIDRPTSLFNGKDLSQFTTWLKESQNDDPKGIFQVTNGAIHISGEGTGCLATRNRYRDYHLSLEYKWGNRTDGSKYVRNSGVLLHAIGKEGSANESWMTSIEVQLAQGCEGDIIVIRGLDENGEKIPATASSETITASDGKTRWKPGGEKTIYSGKQFWWSKHEPGFQELKDTRGKEDVASPLGQWTTVDCICKKDRISVRINGRTVNEVFDVFPSYGKILLQNEGNEVFFRNIVLRPIQEP
jgi:hypothetical protein